MRSTAEPLDVVLDVDTGVDDALALILAVRSPALRVRAVTCVAGNTGVGRVVANTLRVLETCGAGGIPVGRGAAEPLGRPGDSAPALLERRGGAAPAPSGCPADRPPADPPPADPPPAPSGRRDDAAPAPSGRRADAAPPTRRGHGRDGMGDLDLPPSRGRAVPAQPLLREVLSGRPVTVIALGPLTNLGLLARTDPDVVRGIRHLVFAGGASGRDPNLEYDPDAARSAVQVVRRLTAYGPVFADVPLRREDVEALQRSGDPGSRLAGRLAEYQLNRFAGEPATIGDAGAVAAVIRPDLLTTRAGRLCGATVDLAEAVDGEGARRLFLATIVR